MTDGLKWLQCPVCKETIYWKLPEKALKNVKRFPTPIIIKHKEHYVICYVDSHYQVADTEIASGFLEAEAKD